MLWRMLVKRLLSIALFQRCFSVRFFNLYYNILCFEVSRLSSKKRINEKVLDGLMRKVYFLINLAIATENQVFAYKVSELMKLSFGEKLMRNSEPKKLMALIIKAVKLKQYDVAEYLLAAYKTLLMHINEKNANQCLRQLLILLVIMQKRNLTYLMSKVMECIFYSISKFDLHEQRTRTISILALKRIGIIAIRKRDDALFIECKKYFLDIEITFEHYNISEQIEELLIDWFYYILKTNNECLFNLYQEFYEELYGKGLITSLIISRMIQEIPNIAGMAIMNLSSKCGDRVLCFLLKLSEYDSCDMKPAVKSYLCLLKMAVENYGLDKSFSLFIPLLESGRKIYMHEQRFTHSSDITRKKNLKLLLNELIFFFEVEARQSGSTVENIILNIRQYWIVFSKLKKSIPRIEAFCDLLLAHWGEKKNIKKNQLGINHGISNISLMASEDKERLDLVL